MSSIPFFIIAILMLGLLILVHELGHFITGRLLGFKINEFSIGMGPKLLSKEKKGIVYSLRAIPMGGFVAFHGEDDENEDDPLAMNNMPWYKRAVVMFAGAGFNILFSFLVTAILFCSIGYTVPQLKEIKPDTPMSVVAQEGDMIYAVNGKRLLSYGQLSEVLDKIPDDETVKFTVLRNGEKITYEASRYFSEADNKYLFGISYSSGIVDINFFESFDYSFRYNTYITKTMYVSLWDLVTGEIGVENVTGPISTIGQIGGMIEETQNGEAAQGIAASQRLRNTITTIVLLLIIISMNLAIMNLLPFPALDGFRLLFALVEGVTGKHIPRKAEGIINTVGLIVLIGLMVALEISKLF